MRNLGHHDRRLLHNSRSVGSGGVHRTAGLWKLSFGGHRQMNDVTKVTSHMVPCLPQWPCGSFQAWSLGCQDSCYLSVNNGSWTQVQYHLQDSLWKGARLWKRTPSFLGKGTVPSTLRSVAHKSLAADGTYEKRHLAGLAAATLKIGTFHRKLAL